MTTEISIEREIDSANERLDKVEMLLDLFEAKFQGKDEPNEYQGMDD